MNKRAARFAQHSARRAAGSYGAMFEGGHQWSAPRKKKQKHKRVKSQKSASAPCHPGLERQAQILFGKSYTDFSIKKRMRARKSLEGLLVHSLPTNKTTPLPPATEAYPGSEAVAEADEATIQATTLQIAIEAWQAASKEGPEARLKRAKREVLHRTRLLSPSIRREIEHRFIGHEGVMKGSVLINDFAEEPPVF